MLFKYDKKNASCLPDTFHGMEYNKIQIYNKIYITYIKYITKYNKILCIKEVINLGANFEIVSKT
jgi:hypothetical protein